jgi:hypothetical protein
MAIASKHDFIRALRESLAGPINLPKICHTCGCDLIYLHAELTEFEQGEQFTIPLGFCPFCDGMAETADTLIQ